MSREDALAPGCTDDCNAGDRRPGDSLTVLDLGNRYNLLWRREGLGDVLLVGEPAIAKGKDLEGVRRRGQEQQAASESARAMTSGAHLLEPLPRSASSHTAEVPSPPGTGDRDADCFRGEYGRRPLSEEIGGMLFKNGPRIEDGAALCVSA